MMGAMTSLRRHRERAAAQDRSYEPWFSQRFGPAKFNEARTFFELKDVLLAKAGGRDARYIYQKTLHFLEHV